MRSSLLLLAFVGACGGDDGGSNTPIDSAPIDTTSAKVVEVACPGSPAATVLTTNAVDAFMPMTTTIAVGGVVKFVMSSMHDVAPNPIAPMSDPATVVGFGATKCLRFDAAGSYGIYCTTHSFAGTITVQ